MVTINLDKINSLLDELKGLKIKEAVSLRKILTKEKEKFVIPKPKPDVKVTKVADANKRRSEFMKGVWDFVKLIYDNYPQLRQQFTIKDLFSQYFARRRGEDVSISDVFWQNPSPSASLRP